MRVISFILCVFLCGCASPQKTVNLITPVPYAQPTIPEKVILPINALNKDSTPSEVMGAYIKTVRLLIIDNHDLRARLLFYARRTDSA